MKEFICKKCKREFNSYDSLRRHSSRIHKIVSEQFYIEFYCDGIHPTCKCGCGESTQFVGHLLKFNEYKQGHISRIKNNWGHNQIAIDNSAETRRQQYKDGERKVWNKSLTKENNEIVKSIGEQVNKENNPERAQKISNSLSDVPKSKEHIKKITDNWKIYWNDPIHRDEQRTRRVIYLQKYLYDKPSNLEISFCNVLDTLNIQYDFQYIVSGFNYDIKIKDKNILIEIDGDFYHCNPIKYLTPTCDVQKNTVRHDKVKNKIAKDNGYKLIRIWENDIKNNLPEVMKKLLKEIV